MSKEFGIVLDTQADKDLFQYLQNIQINNELEIYQGTPELLHQEIIEVVTGWLEETAI